MTKWDTKFESDDEPDDEQPVAAPLATGLALALAIAPLCCFGLSVAFFYANHSRRSQASGLFSFLMMASIFLAPTVGALLIREGHRRGERWEGWRSIVMFVNILWAVAAVWLGFGLLLSPGRNW